MVNEIPSTLVGRKYRPPRSRPPRTQSLPPAAAGRRWSPQTQSLPPPFAGSRQVPVTAERAVVPCRAESRGLRAMQLYQHPVGILRTRSPRSQMPRAWRRRRGLAHRGTAAIASAGNRSRLPGDAWIKPILRFEAYRFSSLQTCRLHCRACVHSSGTISRRRKATCGELI